MFRFVKYIFLSACAIFITACSNTPYQHSLDPIIRQQQRSVQTVIITPNSGVDVRARFPDHTQTENIGLIQMSAMTNWAEKQEEEAAETFASFNARLDNAKLNNMTREILEKQINDIAWIKPNEAILTEEPFETVFTNMEQYIDPSDDTDMVMLLNLEPNMSQDMNHMSLYVRAYLYALDESLNSYRAVPTHTPELDNAETDPVFKRFVYSYTGIELYGDLNTNAEALLEDDGALFFTYFESCLKDLAFKLDSDLNGRLYEPGSGCIQNQ